MILRIHTAQVHRSTAHREATGRVVRASRTYVWILAEGLIHKVSRATGRAISGGAWHVSAEDVPQLADIPEDGPLQKRKPALPPSMQGI